MKTVSSPSEGLYKEKGSRFISYLYPVKDEEEIRQLLVRIRKEHHSARHHCYAWRLGTEVLSSRSSDDGEPSGTAGKPILGQITANDLTNVLVIVVRYFGGILLGTGGLVQAYRSAAADAIEKSTLIPFEPVYHMEVTCSYVQLNQVYQIIHARGLQVMESKSDEKCFLRMSAGKATMEEASCDLRKIYGVTTSVPMLING
jgi:uncharacterized YigZ family protein